MRALLSVKFTASRVCKEMHTLLEGAFFREVRSAARFLNLQLSLLRDGWREGGGEIRPLLSVLYSGRCVAQPAAHIASGCVY